LSVDFALIVLSIVAVLAFFSFLTGRETFLSFFSLLLAGAATSLISSQMKEDPRTGLLQIMVFIFLAFNFLLSRIEVLRNIKFGVYGTALSTLMLMALGSDKFSIYDFEFSYQSFSIWILPIFGTLIYVGAELLSGIFSQFVGFETRTTFHQLSQLFLLALVSIYAFFMASYFGLFLVGIGYVASSFYREDHTPNAGFSLIVLSLIPFIGSFANVNEVDLVLGKNIFGLMMGYAGVWFLYTLSQSKINPIAFSMFGYIFYLIFTIILLLMGSQRADLGGVEAFLSYLTGSALALTVYHEFKLTQLVFPTLFCIGIYFAPKSLSNNSKTSEDTNETSNNSVVKPKEKNNKKDPFEVKGYSIDELVGNYEIVSSTALINFSLGPKGGRTNGEIKQFSGTIKIEENTGSSAFSINIPVKNLTTKNELRDESLREEGYFNVSKFPKMTFKSKKLTLKKDYYELDGEFTMLGKSKPLKVQIKYIGTITKGEEMLPTFIGKATIDRTKHGMTPDSKEGNIVDFDFKIELKKVKKESKSEKESKPKKKETKPKRRERSSENRPARNNRNSD